MKYFAKYKETTVTDDEIKKITPKTRFFNTEDIEVEWNNFKSLCHNKVELTDIQVL